MALSVLVGAGREGWNVPNRSREVIMSPLFSVLMENPYFRDKNSKIPRNLGRTVPKKNGLLSNP